MANNNQTYLDVVRSLNQAPTEGGPGSTFLARVVHVVTGPIDGRTGNPDPSYNDPTDIGKILFQVLIGAQDRTLAGDSNPPAKPMSSAMKRIPVEGEIVKIVVGPSIGLNISKNSIDYYYTEPFNLWGSNHHNAFPDLGDLSLYANTSTVDYQENTTTNRTNNPVSGSQPFPLGPYFSEQANRRVLRPFVGDVTVEGRWGNSIRFGSTSPVPEDNYWSATGSVGDPITIIRNGQGIQFDKQPWIPTVENINRDHSSIYLTSGQQIVIDDIQNNFPLTSWQLTLDSSQVRSIPLQEQLTSYDNISPAEQDRRTNEAVNNV